MNKISDMNYYVMIKLSKGENNETFHKETRDYFNSPPYV
jgi:hypothetical protein